MSTRVTDLAAAARAAAWLTGPELTATRHALRGAGAWLDANPGAWARVRRDLRPDAREQLPNVDPNEVITAAVANRLRLELTPAVRGLLKGGPIVRSAFDLQRAAERLGAETAQRLFSPQGMH